MASITGTSNSDALRGTSSGDNIYGLAGNDTIYGALGNDMLDGGTGDDIFLVGGSEGRDYYFGGSGVDIISVVNGTFASNPIELDIGYLDSIEIISNNPSYNVKIKTDSGLDLSNVLIVNIDTIDGSSSNNYITGNVVYNSSLTQYHGMNINGYGGNDEIEGSASNDKIYGGDGQDTLIGGLGNDTLSGGAGSDFFRFDGGSQVDRISDFTTGVDKIVLGPSVSKVNVYSTSNSAILEINDTAYVVLENAAASSITSNDIVFA